MTLPAASRRIAVSVVLLALVALAGALRFGRLDEMEYKGDERWMYERAVRIPSQEPWPLVGMRSSVALPNPALSVLIFVGLAKAARLSSPVDLAARVVALNVAALALVFAFAETMRTDEERAAWRWGGALVAVSPFAVLLQRKIWAQSVLPIFSILFLIGWWRRDRRWGAALWGVVGACLGQIHLSGFFIAAAFVLWEWFAGRYRADAPHTRWRWFVAGSAIGGIGIAVWVAELGVFLTRWIGAVAAAAPSGVSGVLLADVRILSFWPSFWVSWFEDATGLGLDYSLGPHYFAFLQSPIIGGHATWLALAASIASFTIATPIVAPWALALARDLRARRLAERLRACDETGFSVGAALGLFGLLLTATCVTVFRHYLIVAFPLPWIWLARLTLRRRRGRALLAGLWIAQLVISLSYLEYIHVHHGADGGDYGRAYRWQVESVGPR